MACDGKTYIPNPPRLWNRVQLPCSQTNVGLTPQEYHKYLMMEKGNILQYKNNSSCLTKKQIYSLIAQGKWKNRNTTWAIQSERGYTNPNTKMLKQNDTTNIIENSCTSYTNEKRKNQFYHPTSDSDVPGPIELLYWNENTPTWYPRQRLVMNNSNNKWPNTSGPSAEPTYIAGTSYENN